MNDFSVIAALTKTLGKGSYRPIVGRGNSQVGVWLSGQTKYFIKRYPVDLYWPRREVEAHTIKHYSDMGILEIPTLVATNQKENFNVFNFIEGNNTYKVNDAIIQQIANFISKIMLPPATRIAGKDAKESFFHSATLKHHIQNRLTFLHTISDPMLQEYMDQILCPRLDRLRYMDLEDYACDQYLLMSPSDFGTHNSLLTKNKTLYFIDFEYAGRDNLFKLLADVYWHVGSTLSVLQRRQLIAPYIETKRDKKIFKNILLLMGVKWSLLLLNEFIPGQLEKRVTAAGVKLDRDSVRQGQLIKSWRLLERVSDMW